MLRVKICGIREPAHAVVAAAAGADFVGMVFAPSRRQVTVQQAMEIVAALENCSPLPFREGGGARPQTGAVRSERGRVSGLGRPALVGVFVNATAEEINRVADECRLDYVQLSGDEPPEFLDDLALPAIKAVRLRTASDLGCLDAYAARGARLLLDSHDADAYGGTGRTGDWGLAAEVATRHEILLAGGLTPTNVSEAVARVRPWGVDVSSGVERDGIKDPGLIEEFVRAVKGT